MRAALLLLVACGACQKPLPPPTAPTATRADAGPPARDVGPLVPVGWTGDRVGPRDAPMGADGDLDFAFRVRVSGAVRAFVLHASDPAGAPHGDEIWDTMTKPETFPESWHMPHAASDSWALAVVDSKGALLNPNVTLPETTFAGETITIAAGDPGRRRFASGRTYTLLVVRPDGTRDRATTTML